MTLADELYQVPSSTNWNQASQPGLTLAEVVDIKDPEKLGRIKCVGLTEEKANEDDWCYVMAPLAGKEHGIQFMPDMGDIVVLGYVNGDRYRPIVLGCLWNKAQPMAYPIADGKNFSFSIKTPAGAEMLFSGEKGKEKIEVKTPKGTLIEMDDEKEALNIQDKGGKNSIKMDLKGGNVNITADKKISIKAGNASLELDGSGKATLKSSNSITLDGAKIEAKAKSAFNASGTQVEIKANGTLDVKSSGIANIKGSLLNLN